MGVIGWKKDLVQPNLVWWYVEVPDLVGIRMCYHVLILVEINEHKYWFNVW